MLKSIYYSNNNISVSYKDDSIYYGTSYHLSESVSYKASKSHFDTLCDVLETSQDVPNMVGLNPIIYKSECINVYNKLQSQIIGKKYTSNKQHCIAAINKLTKYAFFLNRASDGVLKELDVKKSWAAIQGLYCRVFLMMFGIHFDGNILDTINLGAKDYNDLGKIMYLTDKFNK